MLEDVESWPRWTRSITSAHRTRGDRLEVGAVYRLEQPRLRPQDWLVVEHDVAGTWFTWPTRSRGLPTTATHVVERRPLGESAVTLVVEQSGPAAAVVRLVFGGMTRRYLRMEAAGLKATAELLAPRRGRDGHTVVTDSATVPLEAG